MNDQRHEARAELDRLKALEALDTRVNARKRQEATPGVSPEARLAQRARTAEILARWALPLGGALLLAGLWQVLTHASPGAVLGVFAGVAVQAGVTVVTLRRTLS